MKIAEVSIRRPIFASMVILAMVVFGIVSYNQIGVDLYPDVDIPIVTVTVIYEGADPETVESEVTDVIEEAVNTISGIKTLRSESIEGLAQIFIEFELEEDVDVVSQDVRDKVAGIRGELPLEIEPPIVEKFDIDSAPILSIALAGNAPIRELTEYADKTIKPRLEGISGVGSIRLVGKREREVRIWLRADQLRAHDVSVQDLLDVLRDENTEPPGGRVETGTREIIVKTTGKVETVEEFGDLIVVQRGSAPVRVRDIAWVEDGMEDCRSVARLDGRPAVSLDLRRQSGENVLEVANAVKAKLGQLRAELPEGYDLVIAQDLSTFVDQSIREAQGELLRGGTLAVLVILLFLRSWRGSFVAAITIPTTIITTYAFMMAMGFTVNVMTMLALTISVGMIIDDSIVVLENSYRHMEEGKPRMEAAREGIAEIGFAVIATSLAIVAVFIPVAFMTGIVGRFFYEFGLTVTFAVAVSTFIAVTLSPMLCSRVLKVTKQHGRTFNFLERVFQGIESLYRRVLGAAVSERVVLPLVPFRVGPRRRFVGLDMRGVVILSAVAIFVGSLFISAFVGKEFHPEADEGQFSVNVQTPIGTSVDGTGAVVAEIERRLRTLPEVTETLSTIGSGAEERVNVAGILVQMADKSRRKRSQAEVMLSARDLLDDLKHLEISVDSVNRVGGGGFRSAALQYNLRGPDLDQLVEASDEIAKRLKDVPGLVDVNTTYDSGKPQVDVVIDRDKAADLGISVKDLGSAIQALIGGRKATTYEEGGEVYDVRVRLAQTDRNRASDILEVPVRTRSGQLVELGNLVEIRESTGPVQIDRQSRARQITVLANLDASKALGSAMADVEGVARQVNLPEAVSTEFTGQVEMMEESFANIYFSLMLAVVLIYMVLAAQFESLIHPFTVMLSLPLSIVGALGLLALTGRTLNIFSMIGMIMLMGLVTKNAILLIDYTNLLRSRGMSKQEAILAAGPVRLRPILMTAVSTIAGMTPVAIGLGSGAETRSPMGTAIVGGLVTSTLLTLVVIPVVYSVMDDLPGWIRGLFGRTGRVLSSLLGRRAAGAFPEPILPEAVAPALVPADDAPEEAAVSG
ncbi:MAG TPA: efflux RND transporter permease subunit [Thermoguttaceae bacterium]|nr:efflux RND transporter permease subunit [Thermoguttaceae bacterium]